MQLYLIRHAESKNNALPEHLREEDPPITEVGQSQAQHLGQWARTLNIDTLITSPFLRTLQTTRSLANAAPATVHIWHDVFEKGGCYRGHGPNATEGGPGLGRSAIRDHLREGGMDATIDDSIGEHGWWGRDRETAGEARQRAIRVTTRFCETFGASQETVVAVIHADFKRFLLNQMLSPAVDTASLGPLRNTGISKLDYDGSRWTLDWFNSVTHLPANLITSGGGV